MTQPREMTHPRTKVVLQSRQFSASSSPNTPRHSLLRVLKLYYKVASSHLLAPQILRVLKLHYKVASSHFPAPQILHVLKLYYNVASSQLKTPQIAPRTKKLYYKVASSHLPALSFQLLRYSAY